MEASALRGVLVGEPDVRFGCVVPVRTRHLVDHPVRKHALDGVPQRHTAVLVGGGGTDAPAAIDDRVLVTRGVAAHAGCIPGGLASIFGLAIHLGARLQVCGRGRREVVAERISLAGVGRRGGRIAGRGGATRSDVCRGVTPRRVVGGAVASRLDGIKAGEVGVRVLSGALHSVPNQGHVCLLDHRGNLTLDVCRARVSATIGPDLSRRATISTGVGTTIGTRVTNRAAVRTRVSATSSTELTKRAAVSTRVSATISTDLTNRAAVSTRVSATISTDLTTRAAVSTRVSATISTGVGTAIGASVTDVLYRGRLGGLSLDDLGGGVLRRPFNAIPRQSDIGLLDHRGYPAIGVGRARVGATISANLTRRATISTRVSATISTNLTSRATISTNLTSSTTVSTSVSATIRTNLTSSTTVSTRVRATIRARVTDGLDRRRVDRIRLDVPTVGFLGCAFYAIPRQSEVGLLDHRGNLAIG